MPGTVRHCGTVNCMILQCSCRAESPPEIKSIGKVIFVDHSEIVNTLYDLTIFQVNFVLISMRYFGVK